MCDEELSKGISEKQKAMSERTTFKRICEKQKAMSERTTFKRISEKQKAMSEEPPSKGFLRNRRQCLKNHLQKDT
jgi:hypothetical protein